MNPVCGVGREKVSRIVGRVAAVTSNCGFWELSVILSCHANFINFIMVLHTLSAPRVPMCPARVSERGSWQGTRVPPTATDREDDVVVHPSVNMNWP